MNLFIKTLAATLIIFSGLVGMADNGRELLTNAFTQSAKLSFSAELANPFKESAPDVAYLPYSPYWKYYRQYNNGSVFMRIELYRNLSKTPWEVYIKNDSGTYGDSPEYKISMEVIDTPALWMPELLYARIAPEELDNSEFKVTETAYNNIPCYQIDVTFNYTPEIMEKLSRENAAWYKNHQAEYLEKRTFARQFIIDKATGLILSRKHFTRDGQERFSVALKNVKYDEDLSKKLFATPEKIQNRVLKQREFADAVYQAYVKSLEIKPSLVNFNTVTKVIIYLIAGLLLCLAMVFVIKTKQKHQ